MRLLRVGSVGAERPAAYDDDGVLRDLSSLVPVSTGLDQSAMAGLAYSLRSVRLQDAVFLSLPTSGVGTSPDGRSIVLQDTVALAQLRSALARDRVGQFIRDRGIKDLR